MGVLEEQDSTVVGVSCPIPSQLALGKHFLDTRLVLVLSPEPTPTRREEYGTLQAISCFADSACHVNLKIIYIV